MHVPYRSVGSSRIRRYRALASTTIDLVAIGMRKAEVL